MQPDTIILIKFIQPFLIFGLTGLSVIGVVVLFIFASKAELSKSKYTLIMGWAVASVAVISLIPNIIKVMRLIFER